MMRREKKRGGEILGWAVATDRCLSVQDEIDVVVVVVWCTYPLCHSGQ